MGAAKIIEMKHRVYFFFFLFDLLQASRKLQKDFEEKSSLSCSSVNGNLRKIKVYVDQIQLKIKVWVATTLVATEMF